MDFGHSHLSHHQHRHGGDCKETSEDTVQNDTSGDTKGTDPTIPDKAEVKEGEFTANDALETEDAPVTNQPVDTAGIALSPAETKYLADNIKEIGDAVTFTGKIGEKEVSFKVWDVAGLPKDFQPDSIVEFNQGIQTLNRMDSKANELLGKYRSEQSVSAVRDFEQRENTAIRDDLAELQTEGAFPKFKVKPGDKGFDDDPAAQEMAKVVQFMQERNQKYLEDTNKGKQYRHIGFREAFELYSAKNSVDPKAAAQAKEDAERKGVADKISGGAGFNPGKLNAPKVHSGTTVTDILNHYENIL